MFWLKELKVENCSLLDGPIHLSFSKGINFLLGVNGAGKTTLLEIIHSIFSFNFHHKLEMCKELNIFAILESNDSISEIEYTRKRRSNSLHFSAQKTQLGWTGADVSHNINCFFRDKKTDTSIHFIIDNRDIKVQFSGIKTPVKTNAEFQNTAASIIVGFFEVIREIPDSKKYEEFFYKTLGKFEYDCGHIVRFEEGIGSFQKETLVLYHLLERKFIIFSGSQPLNNEILQENNVFSQKAKNDYFTVSLLANPNTQKIVGLFDAEDILFSYYIEDINSGDEESASSIILKLQNISIQYKTNKISFDKLSYGQQRYLLILLHITNNANGCILLDEPVNGLHYSLIETLISRIKDTGAQTFISNQSPSLFDCVDFTSKEEFVNQVTLCKLENRKMKWEKPSKEFADSFWEDYTDKFLNVSTLLKFNNLW